MVEAHERVLGRQVPAVRGADRADRARVHDPFATGLARGAQHVHRAAHVHVVEEVGVGGPEAVDRGQVEHGADTDDGGVERGRVADVGHDRLDVEAGEVGVVTPRLDQGTDGTALVDERAHDRRADESRRPGHEGRLRLRAAHPHLPAKLGGFL